MLLLKKICVLEVWGTVRGSNEPQLNELNLSNENSVPETTSSPSALFTRGCQVLGVLCTDPAGPEDGIRRGYPSRALPPTGEEEG